LIALGLIVLVLVIGAFYGYCQIGRLILALRSQEKMGFQAEKEPLTQKKETEV
jgi:hypothetical protein